MFANFAFNPIVSGHSTQIEWSSNSLNKEFEGMEPSAVNLSVLHHTIVAVLTRYWLHSYLPSQTVKK